MEIFKSTLCAFIITTQSQAAIQVAVLITDGRAQDAILEEQARLAKADNITIFTIGIGDHKKGTIILK